MPGADAVAMVTIAGRNDPPVAVADTAIANEDGAAVSIDVLANDRDIDSDGGSGNLRVVAARAASGAAVSFDAQAGAGVRYAITGQFEYLAQGETATDTITYTIEDRHGARASSTVAVIVNGANDAPVAQNDQGSTDEDATVTLPVLRNDVDPDRSDHLQITAVDGAPIAAGGRATLASGAAGSILAAISSTTRTGVSTA